MKVIHHYSNQLHRKFTENGLVVDGIYTRPTSPVSLSDYFDMSDELSLVKYDFGLDELSNMPDGLSSSQIGILRSHMLNLSRLDKELLREDRVVQMVTSFEILQPDEEPVE